MTRRIVDVSPLKLGSGRRVYKVAPNWRPASWSMANDVLEARRLAERMISHAARRGPRRVWRPWGVRFRVAKVSGTTFRVIGE